jgi:hypothetical protein
VPALLLVGPFYHSPFYLNLLSEYTAHRHFWCVG